MSEIHFLFLSCNFAHFETVWPGTFTLAEFMAGHKDRYSSGNMLELGSATGALSIYIRRVFPEVQLYTSDIDDGGEVESNIRHNFQRNGLACVPHVAHTWGDTWVHDSQHLVASLSPSSASSAGPQATQPCKFKFIVASDILLYVR